MGDGRYEKLDRESFPHAQGIFSWWAVLDKRSGAPHFPDYYANDQQILYALRYGLNVAELDERIRKDLDIFTETGTGISWIPWSEIVGWGVTACLLRPRFDSKGGYDVFGASQANKDENRPYQNLVEKVLQAMNMPSAEIHRETIGLESFKKGVLSI